MNERYHNKRLILCEQLVPTHCVQCDAHLAGSQTVKLMMIDAQGEAVVCSGPVHFCPGCDAVYALDTYYRAVAERFGFDPFALVGFLDMEMLPPERRDEPLGEDPELEIPLVEFVAMQSLRAAKFD